MKKTDKIIKFLEEEIKEAILSIESCHKRSSLREYYLGKKKAYKEVIKIIEGES